MATQRVMIPVSFQYLNGSGDLIPVPAGTALTIIDRNTGNPAVLYSGFTGGSTISSPVTDSGGNVPGYVVQGSYSITAAANLSATPPFTGATINYEAVRGDGVENFYPGAITDAAIAGGTITIDKLASALQQLLVPTGTISNYAGSTAPAGWHLCDGSIQSQTGTFASLYAVIGSTYNTGGEGAGNFRLPNLQGRFTLGAGSGTTGYTNLNDRGGSLNHIHALGGALTTINLGSPAVTVSVPGLTVGPHSHPLSGNGGAQLRALGATILFGNAPAMYVLSGAAGPNFSSSGWAYLATADASDGSSGDTGSSGLFGTQSSYGLCGNTDNSGNFSTSGATASGTVNSGQQASGSVNNGQNSQGGDPAYIVLNKMIKL